MASQQDLAAAIEAIVQSIVGGQRLASDLREDLESIPSGATRFQIAMACSPYSDTMGDERPKIAFQIDVHHRLSSGEAERDYTVDVMLTHQRALLAPASWTTNAEVADVETAQGQRLALELGSVRRAGRVVSWTVSGAVIAKNP